MSHLVPAEVVLVDENVSPEFHDAVRSLGTSWQAPSGRHYLLAFAGRRLVVGRPASDGLSPAPSGDELDDDLLQLGQSIYEAKGADWAQVRLAELADVWRGRSRGLGSTAG